MDAVMEHAKILKWLKREGERVMKGESLALAEGEKTTFEIPAPVAGQLLRSFPKEGTDVAVGDAIAILGDPGETIPADVESKASTPRSTTPFKPAQPQLSSERRNMSPAARRLAQEQGIDLTLIIGTGPGGSVIREDILKAMEKAKTPESDFARGVRLPTATDTIPLSGVRKVVAERLSHSFHTTVPVLLTTETQTDRVLSVLQSMKAKGENATLTAFIVKASAVALRKYPIINSSLVGEQIKIFDEVNIAVAVNTPKGLYAPVIQNADKKSVREISENIRALTEKANKAELNPAELAGSTFTVSNLGLHNVRTFVPIINPPNAAILGIGRSKKEPVVVNEQIAIASIATLSLVFDHRITDGVPASEFLQEISERLENPESLLA